MSTFELLSFPNAEELATTTADRWLEELEMASRMDIRYCVALLGGRIARHFFAAVAALAKGRSGVFHRVHFFCLVPT